MSVGPERWFDEVFEYYDASINNANKKNLDDEAFSPNRNYAKIAKIGSLIENEVLFSELHVVYGRLKEETLAVLKKYGVNTILIKSIFEKDEPHLEIPVLPPEPPSAPVQQIPSTVDIEPGQKVAKHPHVSSDMQPFLPAAEDLVKGKKPPMLLIQALQSAPNVEVRDKIFELTLFQLGLARARRDITPQKFDKRFKALLNLDPSRDEAGNKTHDVIKNILDTWKYSENLSQANMAEALYGFISVQASENMLMYPDLDDCPPKKIVKYLRDAAYGVKGVSVTVEDFDGEIYEQLQATKAQKLAELLDAICARADYESDFLDDLICELREAGYLSQPGKHKRQSYVEEAIRILADSGNDTAEAFLESAWIM